METAMVDTLVVLKAERKGTSMAASKVDSKDVCWVVQSAERRAIGMVVTKVIS